MIGKLALVLLLAAAPASDTHVVQITFPDYGERYDIRKDLVPLIPFCAAAHDAAMAGDTEFIDRTLRESGIDARGARLVEEICITFHLGSLYMLRNLEPQPDEPAPARYNGA